MARTGHHGFANLFSLSGLKTTTNLKQMELIQIPLFPESLELTPALLNKEA
jgi:hypothetical protein